MNMACHPPVLCDHQRHGSSRNRGDARGQNRAPVQGPRLRLSLRPPDVPRGRPGEASDARQPLPPAARGDRARAPRAGRRPARPPPPPLAEGRGGTDAIPDELYTALDWLLARQPAVEAALAARHLGPGSLVLYDVSSTYVTGRGLEPAPPGHSPAPPAAPPQ